MMHSAAATPYLSGLTLPTFSAYTVTEQIHQNERTAVYRAVQAGSERRVVIKVLRRSHPSFDALVKFRNQYTIAQDLSIAGIVKPLSLEPWSNGYALVMEDCGSQALDQYVQAVGSLSLVQALSIGVQMADILNDLGQHGLIHKDIKPANIIIDPQSGRIKLIDFSIASLLPKETQVIQHPSGLEGTLAYLAPEQTGRMNRGIDYRTDFYSLGVTLYELLTGQLPFVADDPMGLVHAHIAKQPPEPDQLNLEIPGMVAAVVLKLMAKDAEHRYQSALGMKHDLERCLIEWKETGAVAAFSLGERDVCDRFLIPEKLYGREAEIQSLLGAFERSAQGSTEMVLVAGFSGIGKTAVINEVHKPITRQQGYFVRGKFEQFNQNIPFSAVIQAFRDLIRQLLSESDEALSQWKDRLAEALGENAQLMIDVIPELETIIGPQSAVPALSDSDHQNRFNRLLKTFVDLFTRPEHPLVLFLDDLQWADVSSLQFLQRMMTETAGYLLVLGAYRHNEVLPSHPLMLVLQDIVYAQHRQTPREQTAEIVTLTLDGLGESVTTQLIADTLHCTAANAAPLSQWVYQKTQGNPFFTAQFLQSLHADKHITFDAAQGVWQCDIAQVKQLSLTNNVLDLMVARLQKLPDATQAVLKIAACMGTQSSLSTLAVVCPVVFKSDETQEPDFCALSQIAAALWPAIQEGFVIPDGETYKFFQGESSLPQQPIAADVNYRFLHDRVQQAAYALIPDAEKEQIHYRIGQLLLKQITPETTAEQIFSLVSQLNHGIPFIQQQADKDELARLNLLACQRAKAATAYPSARVYARIGIELLGERAWQRRYDDTLALYDLAAELAQLCEDDEAIELSYAAVVAHAHDLADQVTVHCAKIRAALAKVQREDALGIALHLLKQLGHPLPDVPTDEDAQRALGEVYALTAGKEIAGFIDLPVMGDRKIIAAIRVLDTIRMTTALMGSPLYLLMTAQVVCWSIRYGNTALSAVAYAGYGMIACNTLKAVEIGREFCDLGIALAEKLNEKALSAEAGTGARTIRHRQHPVRTTLPMIKAAYLSEVSLGRFEYAGYTVNLFFHEAFWSGLSLTQLYQDSQDYTHALSQLNQPVAVMYAHIYQQGYLNLLTVTQQPTVLSGEAFTEESALPQLLATYDFAGLATLYHLKLMLAYLFEETEAAQTYEKEMRQYGIALNGMVGEAQIYFYGALVTLAQMPLQSPDASDKSSPALLQSVEERQATLEHWAHHAPMNYRHKVDLIRAEKCRVLGQKAAAIELYDQAIAGAKAHQYTHEEALANELAAKFYLAWDKERIAADYMRSAYYSYARWGAKAKTHQLAQKYPQLLPFAVVKPSGVKSSGVKSDGVKSDVTQSSRVHLSTQETTALDAGNRTYLNSQPSQSWLDLPAVIKAAQAISQEIELTQLLETLVQIAIVNAGAQNGHLLLPSADQQLDQPPGQWIVMASANDDEAAILETALDSYPHLPKQLIYEVSRTGKAAVFENLSQESRFIQDRYISSEQPKSVLCLPISRQGQLVGILYLENNLSAGVFTRDRIEILQVITSQAAISIENARLYQATENYSRTLEIEVAKKTEDLRQKAEALDSKAQDLEQTLSQLRQTQAQLIHSEKMSSLGKMVAGVAHEINNPVNFIQANLECTSDYIEDLMSLLALYESEYPQPTEAIVSKQDEIDLSFLTEDIHQMLKSMTIGSDRIRDIVLNLRNFSRLDESAVKAVDLHEGLDSTLALLHTRLQADGEHSSINVVKDYGQLPLVTCEASQLNQVFLNILGNAVDAIREQYSEADLEPVNPPSIKIATCTTDDDKIQIAIENNGTSIPLDIQPKIFDPFFTTKPVGSGAGLGLSVSYSIVKSHGGHIAVDSQEVHGEVRTVFQITLPQT
ncbi:MAG: AAA family ATPase [Cyanobacteria bacterium J06573_11]